MQFQVSNAQRIDSTWTRVQKFIDSPMPPVNGITITGQKIDSTYFKNYVVLLSFANLINVGSLQQIPFLNQIHSDFEGKPFKILSVIPNSVKDVKDFNSTTDEQPEAARLRATFNLPVMSYDVLATCDAPRPQGEPIGAACDTIVKDFLIGGYPTVCIIDSKGIIRYVHVGFAPKAQQEEWLATVEKQINILVKSIPPGAHYVLQNIFFETNSYLLQNNSRIALDQLTDLLNQNAALKIQIAGYTDDQGNEEYNMELSEKRAKAVYDYLVTKGIGASRLSYAGYGEKKPVATNATDEGRAQNRRIEFIVTGN